MKGLSPITSATKKTLHNFENKTFSEYIFRLSFLSLFSNFRFLFISLFYFFSNAAVLCSSMAPVESLETFPFRSSVHFQILFSHFFSFFPPLSFSLYYFIKVVIFFKPINIWKKEKQRKHIISFSLYFAFFELFNL